MVRRLPRPSHGRLVAFCLYLHETEHPIQEMLPDVTNHQIDPWICFSSKISRDAVSYLGIWPTALPSGQQTSMNSKSDTFGGFLMLRLCLALLMRFLKEKIARLSSDGEGR
jgi:hypothetical protein